MANISSFVGVRGGRGREGGGGLGVEWELEECLSFEDKPRHGLAREIIIFIITTACSSFPLLPVVSACMLAKRLVKPCLPLPT